MSDPAAEAAQRALDLRPRYGYGNDANVAKVAAREALAPLRELHRKVAKDVWWHRDPGSPTTYDACAGCPVDVHWPCATARLIYAEGEL